MNGAMIVTVAGMVLATPTWAGRLPEATSRRVVVHGVDCSIDNGTVCDTDRPVFDEAIATVPDTAAVVLRTSVLDGMGTLPDAAAAAVRDYFIAGGIDADLVTIEGCPETTAPHSRTQSVEVQLSKASDE